MGGGGESGVTGLRIAVLHQGGDVAGGFRPDQRRALGDGLGEFGDDGQFLVVHHDRFQGVLGLLRGLGDDRDDFLAHEADHVHGEGGAQRRRAGGAVRAREHGGQRHGLDAGGDEVRAD